MKIHPVGAEPFHADRRTDVRTNYPELIAAFRNFANAPKIRTAIRTCSWYRTEHTAFYRAS